jgi:hypothetical protein
MYLIRRVFKCKPQTARKAAELITKIGEAYMNAGQRSQIRVYFSGGTVPGPAHIVHGLDERGHRVTRQGGKCDAA